MIRSLPISLLVAAAIMAVAAPASNAAIYMKVDGIKGSVSPAGGGGAGNAETLASLGNPVGANFLFADGSVRFVR